MFVFMNILNNMVCFTWLYNLSNKGDCNTYGIMGVHLWMILLNQVDPQVDTSKLNCKTISAEPGIGWNKLISTEWSNTDLTNTVWL